MECFAAAPAEHFGFIFELAIGAILIPTAIALIKMYADLRVMQAALDNLREKTDRHNRILDDWLERE